MVKSRIHIGICPDTHEKLKECIVEFLENNPKFEGMQISMNFIIRRIADFYIEQ